MYGPEGVNELLVNSSSHLQIGHICRQLSQSISNFEIVESLFTFFNSRTESESPKTRFIDIVKKALKLEFQDVSIFHWEKFSHEFYKVIPS